MSLFNIRRRDAVDAPAAVSWWSWNPYRRAAVTPGADTPAVGRGTWWRRNTYRRDEPAAASVQRAAYVDGARDQRRAESDVERRAYRQGELDGQRLEARRHRGHPVLATLVFLIALAGVGYGYLSYEEGSFSAGGAVIDEKIAEMRGDAGQTVGQAGVASGQAVQNAGADITARGQVITQRSQALSQTSTSASGG